MTKTEDPKNSEFQIPGVTGNAAMKRCHGRRSAMTTAEEDVSSKSTVIDTATLPSSAAAKAFDFSPDLTMRGPRLTSYQLRYCCEALQCFSAKKFNSPQSIRREFQTLQANRMRALDMRNRCSVALDDTNCSKNRYTDVLPFDNNRVILKQCKDYRPSARGYINTSFVRTSESVSGFIATQGPLPHTYEDFWEMIMQYRCPVIVMLTQLDDNYQFRPGSGILEKNACLSWVKQIDIEMW